MDYEQRLALFQRAKLKEASGDVAGAEKIYSSLSKGEDLGPASTKEEYVLLYQASYRKLILNLSNKVLSMQLAADIVEYFHKEKELEEEYLFRIAEVYMRLEEPLSAMDLLHRLLKEYPNSVYKLEASLVLGRIYHEKLEQPAKAIPYYKTYLNQAKENKRLAASLLADCYIATGDMKAAELTLDKYTEAQTKKKGR